MSNSYDILPKIPIHEYGAILKSKTVLECTQEPELDPPENENNPDDAQFEYIEADQILFYVEDKQFIASSKSHGKGECAWIRFHFITTDKRSLWYTLLCSPKRLWDFETFRKKKKAIRQLFDQNFEVIQEGDDDNYQPLVSTNEEVVDLKGNVTGLENLLIKTGIKPGQMSTKNLPAPANIPTVVHSPTPSKKKTP